MNVETRYDQERGCGWRKEGGLYLISGGKGRPCGKLPLPLERCPTCSAGIKFTRGWTWVDADKLFMDVKCGATLQGAPIEWDNCQDCPLSNQLFGKAGLLWIGEQFYKTPDDWMKEADAQGISRRIKAVPKEFELDKTWVLVAHIRAIKTPVNEIGPPTADYKDGFLYAPGIFRVFKPTAIEYVVKGDETEEELEKLTKRGITPVRVERHVTVGTTI